METALKDKSNIVLKKSIKINLEDYKFRSWEFFSYKDILKEDFDKNDTTQLEELLEKIKSSKPDFTEWTENEIRNRILVEPNESIKLKAGLKKIKWTTKTEKKSIKKEIREYNKHSKLWPRYPIALSRPVYSESGNYAIIELINGGSTGKVFLFKKTDDKWKVVADLKSLVY